MQRIQFSEMQLECSGRTFYANNGIIGIGPEDDKYQDSVSEGYDGGVETEDWTPEERAELAAYMVSRWQEWAGDHG